MDFGREKGIFPLVLIQVKGAAKRTVFGLKNKREKAFLPFKTQLFHIQVVRYAASENMEIRKICQWCGKPFIAQKTTTCYCSHQCSNLGYKERIRERKRQLKRSQELLQPRQAAEGQDFFSFAQAAKLMGVTRQYIYKLVKESKLRASRMSGKKSLIRRADIELMMKTKPYERIMPKEDFDITEYYTAEEIAQKYKVNAKWIWTYTLQHKVPKVRIRQFNYYSKKHIDAAFAKYEVDSDLTEL